MVAAACQQHTQKLVGQELSSGQAEALQVGCRTAVAPVCVASATTASYRVSHSRTISRCVSVEARRQRQPRGEHVSSGAAATPGVAR
jgi:hypothetical protein